jgi:hypothetical protein
MDAHADSARPLPDMLGEVPPEHDLRGRMLVLLIYACGTMLWAAFLLMGDTWGQRVVLFIVAVPFFATAAFLARAVTRFECWSWFFVGGWFALVFLVIVAGFLVSAFSPVGFTEAEMMTAAPIAMMLLGALHYLWLRRWDFWTDAMLERRRPRLRAVTPEWRAARLAGIGSQTVRRRTVSPRPGALWLARTSDVRR